MALLAGSGNWVWALALLGTRQVTSRNSRSLSPWIPSSQLGEDLLRPFLTEVCEFQESRNSHTPGVSHLGDVPVSGNFLRQPQVSRAPLTRASVFLFQGWERALLSFIRTAGPIPGPWRKVPGGPSRNPSVITCSNTSTMEPGSPCRCHQPSRATGCPPGKQLGREGPASALLRGSQVHRDFLEPTVILGLSKFSLRAKRLLEAWVDEETELGPAEILAWAVGIRGHCEATRSESVLVY